MKTMIAKSVLALPLLAGALWVSGAQADEQPTPAPTPTATPTAEPTATPKPVKPSKGKPVKPEAPRPVRQNPTRSTFSFPLDNITVTVNGQALRLSGAISGVALTNQDSAGGLHVRAAIDARNLVVTMADGTALKGVGAANIVANIGARKGAASVANTSAIINLAGPNSTAYRLNARLKVTVNANNEVSVALLSATLKAVSSTNDA